MIRFTVVWRRHTLADLASTWLNSSDRSAVTIAAAQIERLLRADPTHSATEVSEGLWGLSRPPLRILFTVNEADRLVEVVMIRIAATDDTTTA
jgi:hypothetical protein